VQYAFLVALFAFSIIDRISCSSGFLGCLCFIISMFVSLPVLYGIGSYNILRSRRRILRGSTYFAA
jgi:hypothetical protein